MQPTKGQRSKALFGCYLLSGGAGAGGHWDRQTQLGQLWVHAETRTPFIAYDGLPTKSNIFSFRPR